MKINSTDWSICFSHESALNIYVESSPITMKPNTAHNHRNPNYSHDIILEAKSVSRVLSYTLLTTCFTGSVCYGDTMGISFD